MSKPRYSWWGYIREALRRYPDRVTQGEKEAIDHALSATRNLADGENRVAVIEMVFFKQTHTLRGAAMRIPCDYETAKRWQQQFIRQVGEKRGLLK